MSSQQKLMLTLVVVLLFSFTLHLALNLVPAPPPAPEAPPPASISFESIPPDSISAEEVSLRVDWSVLMQVDSLMRASIAQRAFPGAAVAVGGPGGVVKLEGYGYYTYDRKKPVTPHSLFDIASLTKVVATTTAAMKLYEEDRLDLDARVVQYLPAFGEHGKERVTVRQLLSHTAGLPTFRPYHKMGLKTREQVLGAIFAEGLASKPGTEARYSDLGMIVLALVIEQLTGQDFATYTREQIFEPLGMTRTGFRPVGQNPDTSIVPTEVDKTFRKRLIQGEVHDELAYLLGGTAGSAGLFSTAADLARFAHMLVGGGWIDGAPFLKEETIRLFTLRSEPEKHAHALGWDTKNPTGYSSAGQYFGPNSFGHTGFTGTSLWIDPDTGVFVILLTNRIYPTRNNSGHVIARAHLADLAYQALVQPVAPPLLQSPEVSPLLQPDSLSGLAGHNSR